MSSNLLATFSEIAVCWIFTKLFIESVFILSIDLLSVLSMTPNQFIL